MAINLFLKVSPGLETLYSAMAALPTSFLGETLAAFFHPLRVQDGKIVENGTPSRPSRHTLLIAQNVD